MKKYVSLILVLLTAGMLILASCMGGDQPAGTNAATDAATQGGTDPAETIGETANETADPDSQTTAEATTEAPTEEITTEATTTEPVTTEPVDPLAKYQLGYGSTMDMSAFDPIKEHETVIAPKDDPNVLLWFDHITEKVTRYTINRDGKQSYTIQMGKNEMEGCQFFVHSPTERHITVKLSDFTNDKGETLHTELGVGYYVEDGYLPYHGYSKELVYIDAVVPYDSYVSVTSGGYYEEGPWVSVGPYSNKPWEPENYPIRDTSRAFVIQAKTTAGTTPGAYKATIEIYDADTGDCIKMANVYTYVYNVTLSDETALDTTFSIWESSLYEQYAANGSNASGEEILRAVANFLLEYRITPTGGSSFTTTMGKEWLSNPRVTTIRVAAKEVYDWLKDDPVLYAKMFYYGQDEPGTPRAWITVPDENGNSISVQDPTGAKSVEAVSAHAHILKDIWGWEDYRMVSPFEENISYNKEKSRDQIGYMSRYVTIWCPKFYSFTPRILSSTSGSLYTHSTQNDKLYGEFEARMKEYVAEKGHELWAYVSCVPAYTAPYQNVLLFSDGTEARTMFWTCYDLDVTGFLYWHVTNYSGVGGNTYTMRCPFPKEGPGDGILIYPGSVFGQLDPIPSIRLIGMREGIEDYQLLTMLEEAKGEAYTDELVHHIVTSTITYTTDDETVYNVHSYLLRALEEAQNG